MKLPPTPALTPKEEATRALRGGQLYRDHTPVVLPAGAEEALASREDVGRAVWEFFEAQVKEWEKEEGEMVENMKRTAEAEGTDKKGGSD